MTDKEVETIKQRMTTKIVLDNINQERERQNNKWGKQRHEYSYWLTILVEEVGEVAQAIQQGSVAHKKTDSSNLYKELIHVSAVATAIAEQVLEDGN